MDWPGGSLVQMGGFGDDHGPSGGGRSTCDGFRGCDELQHDGATSLTII